VKGSLYTIIYAAIIGSVCALLLTVVGGFTAPYKQANAKADEVRNILKVLEVPFSADASGQELVDTFEANVRVEDRGSLKYFIYAATNDNSTEVKAVAVRFQGSGLWGPIKGFLSLDPDMEIIRGITFYEQEETPGLGGEIESDWFRSQFRGKKLSDEMGDAGIRIVRGGSARGVNEVDAITGATMTCEKVESMLNVVIEQVAKEGNHGR